MKSLYYSCMCMHVCGKTNLTRVTKSIRVGLYKVCVCVLGVKAGEGREKRDNKRARVSESERERHTHTKRERERDCNYVHLKEQHTWPK